MNAWTESEFKRKYEEYVFKFIFNDIKREIDISSTNVGGGNFLCALGLLCYTEFMGGIITGNYNLNQSRDRFDKFFNFMGCYYDNLNSKLTGSKSIYNTFRCGMAHQYFVKENCIIKMHLGNEVDGISMPNMMGLGVMPSGSVKYYFCVEKYFNDFCSACKKLYEIKLADNEYYFTATG